MFKLFKPNQLLKRSSTLLERNKARSDSLTSFPNLLRNFSLSLQIPSPHPSPSCHSPVDGERKAFACCDSGPLCQPPSYQGSCISWQKWQLNSRPPSQVPKLPGREKCFHLTGLAPYPAEFIIIWRSTKHNFSPFSGKYFAIVFIILPDDIQREPSTLCSRCSDEVPSLSVQTRRRCPSQCFSGQPFLHVSLTPGD